MVNRDDAKPSAPISIASLASRAHRREVRGGGRLAIGAALAHHVDAQRRVRQVRGHVDVAAARDSKRVHELGEGLPGPGQAVGHHDAGNVLDPGHHVDEHVVVLLAARREADAAVAHHHRGHSVRRRRGQALRPDGLAVVVGVQVDEARRDQQSGGVDLPRGGLAVDVADGFYDPVLHGYVADVRLTSQPVDDGAIADEEVIGHLTNLLLKTHFVELAGYSFGRRGEHRHRAAAGIGDVDVAGRGADGADRHPDRKVADGDGLHDGIVGDVAGMPSITDNVPKTELVT